MTNEQRKYGRISFSLDKRLPKLELERKRKDRLEEEIREKLGIKDLLVVPHKEGDLTVSYRPFIGYFHDNVIEIREIGGKTSPPMMARDWCHPTTGEGISFRPTTTSEAISVVAHNLERTGNMSEENYPVYLGSCVMTLEGVFTNTTLTKKGSLKRLLNLMRLLGRSKKVKGIYLLDEKVAFAPYETFETGCQDCDTFAQGGLARALEHTKEGVAEKLRDIVSQYEKGAKVGSFCANEKRRFAGGPESNEPLSSYVELVGNNKHSSLWVYDGGVGNWDGASYGVLK